MSKTTKMTPAVRAKKVREMADSISVRNHLFMMVNAGRVDKGRRKEVLAFLDYIDTEVLNTCLLIMPDNAAKVVSATNSDFVQAREKQQSERAETTKQSEEAAEKERFSKGAFSRIK